LFQSLTGTIHTYIGLELDNIYLFSFNPSQVRFTRIYS